MGVHPCAHAGKRWHAGAEFVEGRCHYCIARAQISELRNFGRERITATFRPAASVSAYAFLTGYDLGVYFVDGPVQFLLDVLRNFVANVGQRRRRQVVLICFKGEDGGWR